MASLHDLHINVHVDNLDQMNACIEDLTHQMNEIERKAQEHQATIVDAFLPVLALQAVASPRKVSRRELFGLRWFRK